MAGPELRRKGRVAIVLLSGALLTTAPLWLRTVSFFDVRQVEIVGLRYIEAGTIVSNLDLEEGYNLYESLGPLERKIAGVAGVEAVEIQRHLPATLRVAIVERTPVAFVPGREGLIVLDTEARPLPYDPARVRLDLPLVAATDGALVGVVALVRGLDAEMYAEVIAARRNEDGDVVLQFRGQTVVFKAIPTIGDILKVTVVRRHLAETGAVFDRLDARFDGLVVARRPQA